MATSPPTPTHLSTLLFLLLLPLLISATTPTNKLTPYEALAVYNFPAGILPKGATGYELDEKTGKFKGYLNGTCSFSLEGSYQLSYKPIITGVVSTNKLSNLKGVSVKVLFLWLNIVEVTRTGDELEFSVGIASANFPVDNFLECPQCGCGLDCNGGIRSGSESGEGRVRKLKMERTGGSVSSV